MRGRHEPPRPTHFDGAVDVSVRLRPSSPPPAPAAERAFVPDQRPWSLHQPLTNYADLRGGLSRRAAPSLGSAALPAVPDRDDIGTVRTPASQLERVRVDGKQFACGSERFLFRGVTYGTFQPRDDGARYPDRDVIKTDFAAMREAGFTVVRTYTEPAADVVDLAADWSLRILAGVFYPDWRYLVGTSRREERRVAAEARKVVRASARRFAGEESVLGLCLGNEIPADVVRWVGTERIARVIDELVEVVKEEDPDQLVTYANYPTAEYLPLESLDFLTFNVYLENQDDFRRYLTKIHHLAGDRPLVLGEVGLHAGEGDAAGEQAQASTLDWQLETALERGIAGTCLFSWTDEWWVGDAAVEGWHFGLTREDRSPRPALDVAQQWNQRTVADLDFAWPTISVVICAYNAEPTMEECLRHTCALDYPGLEIVVIDDGSTDATADITRRFPRARLISIEHAGLSVARNAGFTAANGELVAYLDSDAYPTPEWPYYLALGLNAPTVGGVGGPNVPPPDDPPSAHQVARSPGGPVHVLVSDDRAEHVPGCNMAFWKTVLTEVGGFDPIYISAGDDVDVCWKVLDRGWEIGFHPAALVWHHRRPGLKPYLRQQRGYGRSEALVEARHPDRFTPAGSARWRGRIYTSFAPNLLNQRVYRGLYGAAAYQSVYRGGGYAIDLAHQVGVPLATLLLATAPVAVLSIWYAVPAAAALLFLAGLATVDFSQARPPRGVAQSPLVFRGGVVTMHLLQPLVRTWGRMTHRERARIGLPPLVALPAPIRRIGRNVLLMPEDRPRADIAGALITAIRRSGIRVLQATGWEDYDARLVGSTLVVGELVTTSHPVGAVQLRVRPRLRRARVALCAAVAAAVALGTSSYVVSAVIAAAVLAEITRGLIRAGPTTRRLLIRASARAV